MHPGQQVGVVGPVREAVRGDAGDPFVGAADPGDGPFGRLGGPVGGDGDEGAGAAQPAPRVRPVVGVLGDASHGQRVQGLQQQRSEAADQARPAAVDPPGRRTRPEQALVGRGALEPLGRQLLGGEEAADVGGDRVTQPGQGRRRAGHDHEGTEGGQPSPRPGAGEPGQPPPTARRSTVAAVEGPEVRGTAPGQVTAGWLTAVLRADGAIRQARVTDVRAEAVGTGQMGLTARFHLGYDRAEPGAPAAVVGKFPSPDPTSRDGQGHPLLRTGGPLLPGVGRHRPGAGAPLLRRRLRPDWQTVGHGPALADVAYLLGASLSTDVRRRTEGQLLEHYRAGLGRAGVDHPLGRCREDYRREAWAGVIMTVVASQIVGATERGDEMFLTMARRHLAHVADVGAEELIT